jgi:hypothetical protein
MQQTAVVHAAALPTSGDGWSVVGPQGETRDDSVWVTKPPNGCWHWAAGWIALPGPCGSHPLPGWFRRGVGLTVTGCLIGLASGGSEPFPVRAPLAR